MTGNVSGGEDGQTMAGEQADARRQWMGLLARADTNELADLFAGLQHRPTHERVRGPEVGLVMVRGRAGASGQPFNVGEMTVTRCTVRLSDGRIGHAYVGGRAADKAEQAAVLDALLQLEDDAASIQDDILAPLAAAEVQRRKLTAAKTAATKVEFFTMVRSQ
jgi:alpha-D-ribose 1-methylphosphonate 5-triphosphate synthase subunit PhnG